MLKDEIDNAQRRVKTDAYQLSIGEVVNMYKDGELVINPDFQRLFRWEIGQKSKLIESLLLGIPVPPIFVFEKDDATWELIDGLQRLSTLLEFMGELKSPGNGTIKPPTALFATAYLPSLDKAVWAISDSIQDVPVAEQNPLTAAQQLSIKRSRLSVEILKRPSEDTTKLAVSPRIRRSCEIASPSWSTTNMRRSCEDWLSLNLFLRSSRRAKTRSKSSAIWNTSPDSWLTLMCRTTASWTSKSLSTLASSLWREPTKRSTPARRLVRLSIGYQRRTAAMLFDASRMGSLVAGSAW
jgi:hypothetical protein